MTLPTTLLLVVHFAALTSASELQTVAEKSNFHATASYVEVMQLCREMADRSDSLHLTSFGKSFEGRDLPLLVMADPRIDSAQKAHDSGKLVILAIGNIHAGEVCGKEALLMLAREISHQDEHALLKHLVILFAPIYNADGNERVTTDHRPNQAGPANGVGLRGNAQGLDLNRDHVKLESPEARALARLLTEWDPAVVIDTHTTNGSRHRYLLTYDSPRHPATDKALLEFARDRFLPEIRERLEKRTSYPTFFYGNFSDDRQRWETYPAQPRYSTHYFGLRNRIGILSEAYAYASYKDRVLVTLEFVRECLLRCAAEPEKIKQLIKQADEQAQSSGESIAIQGKPIALSENVTVLGYETSGSEEIQPTEGSDLAAKDYQLKFLGATKAVRSVSTPDAYLIPARFGDVVQNLHTHGVACEELREDIELDIEVYQVEEVDRADKVFQNHRTVSVKVTSRDESRQIRAGTILVRTTQPLQRLIVNLLEAESEDGLVTWNYFDSDIREGHEYPVVRLPRAPPLLTAPLKETNSEKKPITFETVYGKKPVNFSGSPASGFQWLDDGEHFLWVKSGELRNVDATTGRCEPYIDRDRLATALAELSTVDRQTAERLAKQTRLKMNPQRTGALFHHGNDLYFAGLQDKPAVRLTSSPEVEELASFSPDGRFIAFVKDFDLYVVDVATQTERALTSGGSTLTRNAKADWVYFEEINRRNWQAYAWSPDSRSIVFQHFDDRGVPAFAVINDVPGPQNREITPYPRAGDPNPRTQLGVVDVAGGDVRWIDLSGYSVDNLLISGFGWAADSGHVYCFAQNRSQRWLDYLHGNPRTGTTKRLFRDQTKAWIEPLAKPHYLNDGSFLWLTERSGWRHLYHYAADGKPLRQLTDGAWEVRRVHQVDEESGWIYFSGTRDSHLAENLYRVQLTGSQLTRLTLHHGDHRVSVAPHGRFFIDSCSDTQTPTKVALYRGDGNPIRTIDTNPVRELDEHHFGTLELLKIKTRAGHYLEGSLLKPPSFDPQRKYPVWVTTYAGPHAPTMRLSWNGGRTFEQLLAHMGILALRVDPRSASGKGAVSAWPAYRQLGVRELEDLEDAVQWLTNLPYVDPSRIGLSGHSYGGFMTAYAMTHSKLFAAGISGAPVTDWHNYDTIYTERYMDTPQENPEGYQKTSVVEAADQLHGRLLILHGAADDNVHLQNTMQLVDALQKANEQFELMIYPQSRHGLHGSHYRRLMIDFIHRTMLE